ncbi:MAG TPA: DUF6518 family protein, partial [Actinomycetota bacterium]|nr:DUF6518 family protein [Actinomycetota bacterium]
MKLPPAMLGVVAGVLLGVVSRMSDLLAPEVGWIGNLFAPWLAVAFVLGRRAPIRIHAAGAGAAALVIAAVTHYAILRLSEHGLDAELFRHPVPLWGAIGAVGGGIFGFLGWLSLEQGKSSVAAAAVLGASFFAEAAFITTVGRDAAFDLAVPLAVLAGVVAPLLALPSRKRAFLAVLLALVLVPFGLRGIGLL